MITIGVTAVGSGIGQSVLRSLANSDLDYRVVGMDASPYNSGIHWVDRSYLVPPAHALDYLARVEEVCRRERVDVLVPGLDTELAILSAARAKFDGFGCTVAVSSPEVIAITNDKLSTYEWCAARGLPFVQTLSLDDAIARSSTLDYPLIVKPRAGSGSAGIRVVHNEAQLLAESSRVDCIVQTYLPPPVETSTDGVSQEPRQTDEVSVQYVLGRDGAMLGEFVSINRLKNGVPVEIVPVTDAPWMHDGLPIAEALTTEGARGPINLQGRVTPDGRLHFFEINARFTGITGVRAMLGFREVEATVRSLLDPDETRARSALSVASGFIGLRHVGDMIVPTDRVTQLAAAGQHAASTALLPSQRLFMTGATGYLGSTVVEQLTADPTITDVTALVRSSGSRGSHSDLIPAVGNLIEELPPLDGIDCVVHAAAARPDGIHDDSAQYRINTEGTRRLLVAARDAGASRFVFVSSQSVYGTGRRPLWNETLAPRPETAYATSKWLAESLCRSEIAGDMQIVILRVARMYGRAPGMRWHELPHLFARHCADGTQLQVHGDGSQRMDLVHVRDVAAAVHLAATVELPPRSRTTINVGGGHPISVRELANRSIEAAESLGISGTGVHQIARAGQLPPSFGMDIRRARAILGWSPSESVDAAVRELVAAAQAKGAHPEG